MTWDSILEWALPVIGGGGIGSAITYLGTYKSKKKKGEVVAEAWVVKCVAVYDEVWDEGEGV